MKLTHLPNEIFLQITESLSPPQINSLLRANRHLSLLLPSTLLSSICRTRSQEYGVKAIYFFAERRDKPPIRRLIEKGALEFIEDGMLLHDAVMSRSCAVVETLLECGVPVNTKDTSGRSPVYLAVKTERLDVLEVLLQRKDVDVNTQAHRRGKSPFYVAVNRRHIPAVKILLSDGRVDVNLATNYGETPLHFAARWVSWAEIGRMLLEDERLDVNCLDVSGYTPLRVAVSCGNAYMVQLLLQHPRFDAMRGERGGETLVHIATTNGNAEIVRMLLDDGRIDPSVPDDPRDWTPLHRAVHIKNEAIVKLLLADKRININCRSNIGKTPLHLAVVGRDRGILKLLLADKDIDVHAMDDDGKSPLELAVGLEDGNWLYKFEEEVWGLAV